MKVGLQVKIEDNRKAVEKAVNDAALKNIPHALATVRKYAQASMVPAKGPSAPGKPPHVHRGRLWRAIQFAYDKTTQSGVVGPRYIKGSGSYSPLTGRIHEFGGVYGTTKPATKKRRASRPRRYPARPFMSPALDKAAARMASDWKSSITN